MFGWLRRKPRFVERCPVDERCRWDGSGDGNLHVLICHRDVCEPDPIAAGRLYTRPLHKVYRRA